MNKQLLAVWSGHHEASEEKFRSFLPLGRLYISMMLPRGQATENIKSLKTD